MYEYSRASPASPAVVVHDASEWMKPAVNQGLLLLLPIAATMAG
jgi:hypothetical protein